jgi:hypothetical protein
MVPRHVPDPDVAVRWPEPAARFNPLVRVTLMLPESATRHIGTSSVVTNVTETIESQDWL